MINALQAVPSANGSAAASTKAKKKLKNALILAAVGLRRLNRFWIPIL